MSPFVKVLTISLSVCATMCGSPLAQDISTMNRQQLEDACIRLKDEISSLVYESSQLSQQLTSMENNQPYPEDQATQILDRMTVIQSQLGQTVLLTQELHQRKEELKQQLLGNNN